MEQRNSSDNNSKKPRKRMSIVKMVAIDTGLLAASLGAFFYFDYLRPQSYSTNNLTVVTNEEDSATFALPSASPSASKEAQTEQSSTEETASPETEESTDSSSSNKSHSSSGSSHSNRGNTNTSDIASDSSLIDSLSAEDITKTEIAAYKDEDTSLTITKNEVYEGSDKITYYVADVYITNLSQIETAFAEGTYGKNIKDTVSSIASKENALFAVNGDFYGNSEEGVVIRNGVLYRSDLNDADICVLFTDGTMKTYASTEFDADTVISEGAWQAWTFGPSLLNSSSNINSTFTTTSYLNGNHPRTAIGYVEPGHYIFMVVDGRDEGYSKGATLTELACFMSLEGCTTAYNLDGGKSSAMYYNGEYINQPADSGREVSDIIYIGK